MPSVMNPKTGEEIECILDPKEVFKKLKKVDNTFAQSLVTQYLSKGTLSPSQWFWFYKIGQESFSAETKKSIDLPKSFVEFFNNYFLNSKLEKPKIGFLAIKDPSDSGTLGSLESATELCKIYKGIKSICVKGEKFYGKIKDGPVFEPAKDCPQYVIDSLVEFAHNPFEQASIDGKVKGICMFCFRELTNDESVYRGYGPICADYYGLPYDHSKQKAQY